MQQLCGQPVRSIIGCREVERGRRLERGRDKTEMEGEEQG